MTKRTEASRDLERSTGSLADLVEFVLQGIDLPFDFFKGGTLWRDEQASVLTPDIA